MSGFLKPIYEEDPSIEGKLVVHFNYLRSYLCALSTLIRHSLTTFSCAEAADYRQ